MRLLVVPQKNSVMPQTTEAQITRIWQSQKCLKANTSCAYQICKGDTNVSEKRQSLPGLVYECVKCGAKVALEELELRGGGVKCTYCGYRVLRKIRPPVVKRIKAK